MAIVCSNVWSRLYSSASHAASIDWVSSGTSFLLKPDKPAVSLPELYFYYINDWTTPDVLVDVTDHYALKQQALGCYRSQFIKAEGDDAAPTPLNQGYIERVQARDALLGQARLIPYAEGFTVKTPYLVHLFGASRS